MKIFPPQEETLKKHYDSIRTIAKLIGYSVKEFILIDDKAEIVYCVRFHKEDDIEILISILKNDNTTNYIGISINDSNRDNSFENKNHLEVLKKVLNYL